MKKLSREEVKEIFKKVKHIKKLRLPSYFDEVEWEKFKYLSWIDESDDILYTIYEYNSQMVGLRWEITRPGHEPLMLSFCDICHRHGPRNEIFLVTTEVTNRPKSVEFMARGRYLCGNCSTCNANMADEEGIRSLYDYVLNREQ